VTTIVVAFPWNADDEMLAPLRARFPDVDIVAQPHLGRFAHHRPDDEDELTDEALAVWARAEGTLALDLPSPVADIAPKLRWIQAIGAGIDHLDGAGIPDAVVVTNAAGVAAAPIAEFVMARLLALWKRLPEIDAAQAEHRWSAKFGRTVDGLTLGVIGLGAIGTAVALRARGFGMTVIGTRRSYTPGQTHEAVHELRGTGDLHDVLARCDAVVVSAPGTPETENLFDAAAFATMKPGAVFCNVGRGSLVDEPALIAALESGHVGAAVLDVTRNEPLPPDDPLWSAPNVHISPHCSAAQDRYTETLLALFADNLERYLTGRPLRNVVDRAAGY
jgi:phosphoglycerate dehydrogenase-like enzyme